MKIYIIYQKKKVNRYTLSVVRRILISTYLIKINIKMVEINAINVQYATQY